MSGRPWSADQITFSAPDVWTQPHCDTSATTPKALSHAALVQAALALNDVPGRMRHPALPLVGQQNRGPDPAAVDVRPGLRGSPPGQVLFD
jgi:hypothetical protein